MKTSIATTLSVVGVLAAGGVALAVNTSVLDTATNQFSASQALEANISEISSSDTATSNSTTNNSVETAAAPSAAVNTSYNIDGMGVVTLSQEGSSLSVENVTPADGYTFNSVNESPSRIEVTFKSGAKSMKFHADIIGDRIITSVINEPIAVAGAPRPHQHGEEHEEDHDVRHEEGEDDDD